jgi:hypothetical protein
LPVARHLQACQATQPAAPETLDVRRQQLEIAVLHRCLFLVAVDAPTVTRRAWIACVDCDCEEEDGMIEGFTPWPADVAARYRAAGLWEGRTIAAVVAANAPVRGDKVAVVDGERTRWSSSLRTSR